MSRILDPTTGLPVDVDRLLGLLRVWTTDPQILHTLIVGRRQMTSAQVITMGHRVRATIAGEPKEWVLSPLALVVFVLEILKDRDVRRVIAKRTLQETRKEFPEATAASALAALMELKQGLERDYNLEELEERWAQEAQAGDAGLILPGGKGDSSLLAPRPSSPPGPPRIISG